MSALENVLYGAIAGGVNPTTVGVLHALCAATLACLAVWLGLCIATPSLEWLVPHVWALLFLALGLWGSVTWLLGNLGTVSPAAQRKELGLEGERAEAEAGSGVEPFEGAEEETSKKDS